jgi:hypothetical protein
LREERKLWVFQNRVLRRIFGSRRDKVAGEWRKMHTKELNLYCLPNVFRVIISRRMRWAGHVACMGRGTVYTGFWWRNFKERNHLVDPGVGERIIVRWIFRKLDWGGGHGLD